MSIRARMTIAVFVALLLAAGGVAAVLITRSQLNAAEEKDQIVEDMITTLLKLNVLRAEYEITGSEQAYQQWLSQHGYLEDLLARAAAAYPGGNEIVDRLRQNNVERLQIFEELHSSLVANTATGSPMVMTEAQNVTVGRLLVLAQSMLEDSSLLSNNITTELADARSLSTTLSILVICLLALVVLFMAFLVGVTVLRSVSKFKSGAEAVASGDLDYHIDLKRKNEIGEAASVFNRMTDNLRVSTRALELSRDELEEQVKLRTAELERANAELNAYASVVSHDLRGPLANAVTANQMLVAAADSAADPGLREQFLQYAGLVGSALETARELVTSLLELAEAGQRPVRLTDVSVSKVVAELLRQLRPLSEERSTRFEIEDDLGVIRGDRTQVYQVFANLISNSLRHNDNAHPLTSVRNLGEEDGVHRYMVRDNGTGFREEDLDNIFKPLFKGAKTSDIGLGLSIVDKVIGAYGGRIRAYNDQGACFEFEIPDWRDA